MPFLSKVLSFWNNLFRRRQVEHDLNDELQAYVEEMVQRKIQAGLAPEAAHEAALLELGGIERIKDLVREQRVGFGDPRRTGVIAVVAIVAFVSGASAAVGVLHWKVPAPTPPSAAAVPVKAISEPLPVLEGRLVDNTTGQPIPFVEIGIKVHPSRRFTYTDETGHFIFTNPPEDVYGLEAGHMYWSVNLGGRVSIRPPFPSNDSFEILGPGTVSVKDKNGQPTKGQRVDFQVTLPNGTQYPPPGKELRRFRYDSSVIELRADNMSPGKLASR